MTDMSTEYAKGFRDGYSRAAHDVSLGLKVGELVECIMRMRLMLGDDLTRSYVSATLRMDEDAS